MANFVQFKIIVQHPWTGVPYAVFDTFHSKKCVHIKWSQLPKWNKANFKGGHAVFSLNGISLLQRVVKLFSVWMAVSDYPKTGCLAYVDHW